MRIRSWLYVPGHQERMLARAFDVGADAVVVDLEDAVPPDQKMNARALAAEALQSHPGTWIRINRPHTELAVADLTAVGPLARGIRIPKVERPSNVEWVHERVPEVRLTCTIETPLGVVNAFTIASCAGVENMNFGGTDLASELETEGTWEEMLVARSTLVIATRAAGKGAPIDTVFGRLDDLQGLRDEASRARRLGFFGKSAIHPSQVPVINEVFTVRPDDVAWATRVIGAFNDSAGGALRLDDGEFVDAAVVRRARQILDEP